MPSSWAGGGWCQYWHHHLHRHRLHCQPQHWFPGTGDVEGAGPPLAGEGEWASGPPCCWGSARSWEEVLRAAGAAEMLLPLSQSVGSCLSQRLFYFWRPHHEVPIRPLPGAMASAGARSPVGAVGSRRGHTATHAGKAAQSTPQIPLSPDCSDPAPGLTHSQCPQSPMSPRISWGCGPGGISHSGMVLFWMVQPAAKVPRCSAQDRCGMLSTGSVWDAQHRAVWDARHGSGAGSRPGHGALLCTCLHITKSCWLQRGPIPSSPNPGSAETITPLQAPMGDRRVPGWAPWPACLHPNSPGIFP